MYPTHADFVVLGGPGCDLAAAWWGTGCAGERAFRTAWLAVQHAAARQAAERARTRAVCDRLATLVARAQSTRQTSTQVSA